MASVPCQARALPLQGSTDLGRRIGPGLVQWKTRQGGEEFADELQLVRCLRPGSSKRVITVVRS
jgi:hypothetical protein